MRSGPLKYMQVYKSVVGAKFNISKSSFLALGELRDLTHEWVKILGVEFDPALSGWKAWKKTEAKVKPEVGTVAHVSPLHGREPCVFLSGNPDGRRWQGRHYTRPSKLQAEECQIFSCSLGPSTQARSSSWQLEQREKWPS